MHTNWHRINEFGLHRVWKMRQITSITQERQEWHMGNLRRMMLSAIFEQQSSLQSLCIEPRQLLHTNCYTAIRINVTPKFCQWLLFLFLLEMKTAYSTLDVFGEVPSPYSRKIWSLFRFADPTCKSSYFAIICLPPEISLYAQDKVLEKKVHNMYIRNLFQKVIVVSASLALLW